MTYTYVSHYKHGMLEYKINIFLLIRDKEKDINRI